MLVNIELKIIADEYGALSPELAVGFRAARAARDRFDGQEEVTASVRNSTAAAIAVRKMMKDKAVLVRDQGRHEYVFYHLPTGSVLRLELRPGALNLPSCCSAVESALLVGREVQEEVIHAYHAQVDALVGRLLVISLDRIFSIQRYRCRPAGRSVDELCRFSRCERCGVEVRLNRLYDVEDFRLCASCAAVEPSWFRGAEANAGRKVIGVADEELFSVVEEE